MSVTHSAHQMPGALSRAGYARHQSVRHWTTGGPVDSELLEDDDLLAIRERSVASVADPDVFAWFGLAVGTFLLGFAISGFIPASALRGAIAPMLILAGVTQFIGGLFALRRDDAFAGTTFCILGAHYAAMAVFLMTVGRGFPATGGAPLLMLALELYCFGYIALVLGAAALRRNLALVITLLALVPGYVLTGMTIWYGAAMPGVATRIGGYCLIASAAFAAYVATATLANSMMQGTILPMPGDGTPLAIGRTRSGLGAEHRAANDPAAAAPTETTAANEPTGKDLTTDSPTTDSATTPSATESDRRGL